MIFKPLRNNCTDFERWCRRYIHIARSIIKLYESDRVGKYYRSAEYDNYQEAMKIMRQYYILKCSLTYDESVFLDECLIGKKYYSCYIPENAACLRNIYDNWQEICFKGKNNTIKAIDPVRLGAAIKHAREYAGLNRTQVSDLLGINIKTLNAYESGTRMIKLDVLYGMSQIYKSSIDEIISKSMLDF